MKNKLEHLRKRLKGMKEYLLLKYDEEDWHGVADAAMDIREIVAQMKCIEEINEANSKSNTDPNIFAGHSSR